MRKRASAFVERPGPVIFRRPRQGPARPRAPGRGGGGEEDGLLAAAAAGRIGGRPRRVPGRVGQGARSAVLGDAGHRMQKGGVVLVPVGFAARRGWQRGGASFARGGSPARFLGGGGGGGGGGPRGGGVGPADGTRLVGR